MERRDASGACELTSVEADRATGIIVRRLVRVVRCAQRRALIESGRGSLT